MNLLRSDLPQVLSHLLMAAVTCLASLENQKEDSALVRRGGKSLLGTFDSLKDKKEDSPLMIRGGKSLLGTFPFNAQHAVDDLNQQERQHQHHADNNAAAAPLPASQALGARDAKQVEITTLLKQ